MLSTEMRKKQKQEHYAVKPVLKTSCRQNTWGIENWTFIFVHFLKPLRLLSKIFAISPPVVLSFLTLFD
jgi:hypothetical protein